VKSTKKKKKKIRKMKRKKRGTERERKEDKKKKERTGAFGGAWTGHLKNSVVRTHTLTHPTFNT
jgi:hypothetical protein